MFRLKFPSFMVHSKKAWYLSHINDPYVKRASIQNYRSRASYKLIELLQKYPQLLLKTKPQHKIKYKQLNSIKQQIFINNVLDLGASPGSWSQVVKYIKMIKNVVSVDLLHMKDIQGVDFYQFDARNQQLHQLLKQKYGKFQLIISDMAPNFSGDNYLTHQQILQLNILCVQLCLQLGTQKCNLIMKSIQGIKQKYFYHFLSALFQHVSRQKPHSSKSKSMEFYYVCQKIHMFKKISQIVSFVQSIGSNVMGQLDKYQNKNIAQKQIQKYIDK